VEAFTPVLNAGIAADAAGDADLARDHFEDTLRFEDANASRLYHSAVRFWFGRQLVARAEADSRGRGVALLAEAAGQFGASGWLFIKTTRRGSSGA
jgi:hypothetical protein